MLSLVSGHYPAGPGQVAVTQGVATTFNLRIGDVWHQGGKARQVVGIVQNPQSLLDEFALVLFLKDVYWSEQGRLSVEVVFVAIALCGLAVLGWVPEGFAPGPGARVTAYLGIILGLIVNLVFVVVCLLKGKVWSCVLGVYVGLIALVGAIRLARPGSPWARRRYPPGSRKMARARAREQRYAQPVQRLRIWFQDLIAGRPGLSRLRKRQMARYGRALAGS